MSTLNRVLFALALLAALLVSAWHWHSGEITASIEQARQNERQVWQEREAARTAAETAAILANEEKNRQIQAAQDAVNLKIAKEHEKLQSALKAKSAALDAANSAAGGLRVPRAICDSLGSPAAPSGDGQHDAYLAATVQLPASTERFLNREADRADEVVEVARECQNWVRAHGFYPESSGVPGSDLAAQPSGKGDPL